MVGGGALQLGDICLVEDISKRSGALGSDLIAPEPVRARSRMKMVSECVKSGRRRGILECGDHRLVEDGSKR